MTSLVCLADVARLPELDLVDGGFEPVRPAVLDPAARGALDELLAVADGEALWATPGDLPRLIVLVEQHPDPQCGVLLGLLRAARDVDVVVVPCSLPPLALLVLVEQVAVLLAAYEDDGATLAALPALTADLDVVAWLGSVGGLAHLPTGVTQHLRSYVPGTAFVARASEDPVVLPTSDRDASTLIPSRPGRGAAIYTSPKGNPAWVQQVALRKLVPRTVVEALPPRRARHDPRGQQTFDPGKRWWGTSRCVEVVGYALDPLAVVADVAPSHTCTWCGRPGSAEVCPFCGMTLLAGSPV